jgi:hypothetical protein
MQEYALGNPNDGEQTVDGVGMDESTRPVDEILANMEALLKDAAMLAALPGKIDYLLGKEGLECLDVVDKVEIFYAQGCKQLVEDAKNLRVALTVKRNAKGGFPSLPHVEVAGRISEALNHLDKRHLPLKLAKSLEAWSRQFKELGNVAAGLENEPVVAYEFSVKAPASLDSMRAANTPLAKWIRGRAPK